MIWFDKTDCELERVSGDEIFDLRYHLLGEGREYELIFLPARGTSGSFSVNFRGDVVVAPKLVPYRRAA